MHNELEIIEFTKPTEFRDWLHSNIQKQEGVWLRIYKKASGVASVTYAEALDEALCYGWIDGQRKSYDDVSFIQKFTPRRKRSMWSKRNIEHVERLRNEGKMTSAGEAEIQRAMQDGRWDAAYDAQSTITEPDYFVEQLTINPTAKAAYDKLNKSARFALLYKLQTATTEPVRQRRIQKIISDLTK